MCGKKEVAGGSPAANQVVALRVRVMSHCKANDALTAEVAGQAAIAGKIDRVSHKMLVVRCEALESLQSLDVAVVKGHSKVRDGSRSAVGCLRSPVGKVSEEKAVRLQVHVDRRCIRPPGRGLFRIGRCNPSYI